MLDSAARGDAHWVFCGNLNFSSEKTTQSSVERIGAYLICDETVRLVISALRARMASGAPSLALAVIFNFLFSDQQMLLQYNDSAHLYSMFGIFCKLHDCAKLQQWT